MEDQEIEAPYEDPGAAPYGNFPNYYSFNPPENRVSLLPPGKLRSLLHRSCEAPIMCLDVGCNSGDLSVALYNHLLQPSEPTDVPVDVHFLGCDIDANLIAKAQASNPFPKSISYVTRDIMDSSEPEDPIQHFLNGFNRSTFDLGFCMSITMWIHLNHGDQGLIDFLGQLTNLCDYLLIEPQPWKCYRKAARRLRKLGRQDFDHFRSLSIHGDMAKRITGILTKGGRADLIQRFGKTSWDRSLLLYRINRPTK
ncbi:pre-miRNA 5 -monophosphate methyltransferase [Pelobates cultripes]|uniref:RNA methyltransferase n=1 Tax=Pelobates cultripes TaxID=61616 RepID=A0AAD1VR05_PELCU|nr:pre-miRNA 5 -monophosphate methyltransferase [Pelobates cultripes]